jgi:hypothetical protein
VHPRMHRPQREPHRLPKRSSPKAWAAGRRPRRQRPGGSAQEEICYKRDDRPRSILRYAYHS